MTAAIQDVITDKLGTENLPPLPLLSLPCEANKTIFGGTIVCSNAAGNAVNAADPTALYAWGRCERQINNTVAPLNTAGAQNVLVKPGVFFFTQDGTITQANVGQAAFAVDDQTISLSPLGSSAIRPFVGMIKPPGLGKAGLYLMSNLQAPVEIGVFTAGIVLHLQVPLTLATIQTKTSGTAFALAFPLPANARLVGSQINVATPLSGGGLSAATATLQGGTDPAGSIIASSSVFTGAQPVLATVGTNPYEARGGQQIYMTLTATGATLAAITAGSLSVDLFYTIVA